MAAMTKLLTLTELEELVRSDPDIDPDDAMEFADWLPELPVKADP
jgi:hypothetical protein